RSLVTLCSASLFFFFSSRRRHTRLVSDWSSDVCSSDLPDWTVGEEKHSASESRTFFIFPPTVQSGSRPKSGKEGGTYGRYGLYRSEKGRVGEERRVWGVA